MSYREISGEEAQLLHNSMGVQVEFRNGRGTVWVPLFKDLKFAHRWLYGWEWRVAADE